MHPTCYEIFQGVAAAVPLTYNVLDVGSYDVNGCLRPLFSKHQYTGCDISPGPNVDVVQKEPHVLPFEDASFGMIVSANCLEHTTMPWKLILEMDRVLRPGGAVAITLPWVQLGYHAYPIDCYRISPDGFSCLFGEWMEENGRKRYSIFKNEFSGIDTFFWARKL